MEFFLNLFREVIHSSNHRNHSLILWLDFSMNSWTFFKKNSSQTNTIFIFFDIFLRDVKHGQVAFLLRFFLCWSDGRMVGLSEDEPTLWRLKAPGPIMPAPPIHRSKLLPPNPTPTSFSGGILFCFWILKEIWGVDGEWPKTDLLQHGHYPTMVRQLLRWVDCLSRWSNLYRCFHEFPFLSVSTLASSYTYTADPLGQSLSFLIVEVQYPTQWGPWARTAAPTCYNCTNNN